MNRQDIAIVVALVALLAGWIFFQNKQAGARRAEFIRLQRAAMTNAAPPAAMSAQARESAAISDAAAQVAQDDAPAAQDDAAQDTQDAPAAASAASEAVPSLPARLVVLSDSERSLTLTSKGASLLDATLSGYRKTLDKDSGDFVFSFTNHPALALTGLAGLGGGADYDVVSCRGGTQAVFSATSPGGLSVVREVVLLPGYAVRVRDVFENSGSSALSLPAHSVSMGEVRRIEKTRNNVLAVDNLPGPAGRGKYGKVEHWEKSGRLFTALTGRRGGGCSSAAGRKADGLPESGRADIAGPQAWVALKSRFFAQVFSAPGNRGCRIDVEREPGQGVPLAIASVRGAMEFDGATLAPGESLRREYSVYIGPKKLSVLRRFGPKTKDVMDFGFFAWFCDLLVPVLNFLNLVCRNYGVAIIVLTLVIRLLFWPLTHKSNDGMKRMQAIQPQLKELQAKFKEDPQKLQQETMRLYRENKVNPLSSCLPMFVQIPVFIALFTILRSAVELRFAPFLWIADLSEPENLLKGAIPFIPALNILPVLMCVTMYLQSKMTPSMGDPAQQRMMAIMMPALMLFMFYSMPSALLLYWTVSQALAIAQLAWQKRQGRKAAGAAAAVIEGEALPSRQARRRAEREERQ